MTGVLVYGVRVRDNDEAQLRASSGTTRCWRSPALHHLQLLVHGRGRDPATHGRVPSALSTAGSLERAWKTRSQFVRNESSAGRASVRGEVRSQASYSRQRRFVHSFIYSVFPRCWLGGRKGARPAEN